MLTTRWELWVDLQDSSDLKRTALELFILPIWDLRSKRMGGFWGFKLFNVVPKVKNTEFCSQNADTSAKSLQKCVKIAPKTFRPPFRHHATDTIFVNDKKSDRNYMPASGNPKFIDLIVGIFVVFSRLKYLVKRNILVCIWNRWKWVHLFMATFTNIDSAVQTHLGIIQKLQNFTVKIFVSRKTVGKI